MKKLISILLMLLFAFPVLAEAPGYTLNIPDGAACEESEGAVTFVYGTSRVVAVIIERVPDKQPRDAVIRMMAQFDPAAVIGEDVPLKEGFVGVYAVTKDKFGEGVDALTAMILSAEGDLLILSGYDMSASREHAQALLNAVLACVQADGDTILLTKE